VIASFLTSVKKKRKGKLNHFLKSEKMEGIICFNALK